MSIGDFIGVGEGGSMVLPLWLVKMAVKMADTADNNYTEPDRKYARRVLKHLLKQNFMEVNVYAPGLV